MTQITYRKTKQGEWVAFGPTSMVRPGLVTVTRRDGTLKTERVTSLGRTFLSGGVECVYGYLGERQSQQSSSHRPCDECGYGAATTRRSDSSGIPGMVCGRCASKPAYDLSFA